MSCGAKRSGRAGACSRAGGIAPHEASRLCRGSRDSSQTLELSRQLTAHSMEGGKAQEAAAERRACVGGQLLVSLPLQHLLLMHMDTVHALPATFKLSTGPRRPSPPPLSRRQAPVESADPYEVEHSGHRPLPPEPGAVAGK